MIRWRSFLLWRFGMGIDNMMYKQILLLAVLIVGFLLLWFIPSIIKKFKKLSEDKNKK
jgi:hypothetical protein